MTKLDWVFIAIIASLIFIFQGCASPRALVDDCKDVPGTSMKNCEIVKKL